MTRVGAAVLKLETMPDKQQAPPFRSPVTIATKSPCPSSPPEWNVRDSDGTVVFTLAREVTGGSLKTIGFAKKHGKPCIHISRDGDYEPALTLQWFVQENGIKILNVAGSRESKEPGIHDWVMQILEDAFF